MAESDPVKKTIEKNCVSQLEQIVAELDDLVHDLQQLDRPDADDLSEMSDAARADVRHLLLQIRNPR